MAVLLAVALAACQPALTFAGESPALAPSDAAAQRLQGARDRYRAIEAAGGWPAVPDGPKLELGDGGPRVETLKRRLAVTGDLGEVGTQDATFNAALDAAVRGFQARHGLLVDGIVGKRTLAALAVPVERRLETLQLNLQRLAARPAWGERYLAVNVAGAVYRLVEQGRTVLERPAIVGRPSWPTPVLEGLVDRLELNPYWTVPPRIARLELLPKIERDPDYLRRNEMRWVDGLLRQDPGPKNPLGKVKFLFDNPYSVYLHDTSDPRLFQRAERFLSHGCVRVADALELATLLLARDPTWTPQRIEAAAGSGETLRVALARPLPLHIVYETAWVDEAGRVNFRDDVYGLDRRLAARAEARAAGPDAGCATGAPAG